MSVARYFLSTALKKRPLRLLSTLAVSFSLAFGPLTAHADPSDIASYNSTDNSIPATGSIVLTSAATSQEAAKVDFNVSELDTQQASAKLKETLELTDADMVIVTSDEETFLNQTVEESKNQPAGRLFLAPYGKAVDSTKYVAGRLNDALKYSGLYLYNSAKEDKIGFMITTFGVGADIVRWIHVSDASNFMITSSIIYTVLWQSLFLSKDSWSKVTKPIQAKYRGWVNTLRKQFGKAEIVVGQRSWSDLGFKFAAGVSLSLALNSGRVMLLGIDHWAETTWFELSMPLIMGALMTSSGFTWSELIGQIDKEVFPNAKQRLRWVMNNRSVVISLVAASAMLLNPSEHGIMPWIYVAINGVAGFTLYKNAAKIVPYLERIGTKQLLFGMAALNIVGAAAMNTAEYGIMPWVAAGISGFTGLVIYKNADKFAPLFERIRAKQPSGGMCRAVFATL